MCLLFSHYYLLKWSAPLAVRSEKEGLTVYVEGDSIGITHADKYPLKPGKYTVSFFAEDSFNVVYNHIKCSTFK